MCYLKKLCFWKKDPEIPVVIPKGMDRALLVGINAYPGCPLSGCVNDVMDMKNLLISKYGFSPDSIIVLIDGEATTEAILDKLKWLCGATSGSRVLFHYSGHGTQVPSNTEADGLSECVCPVDFDWTPEHMITDKQLVDILKSMPSGVRFNWCSDSCHSGDLDRNILNPKKLFPWNSAIHKIVMERRAKKNISSSFRSLANGGLDVGYISGCKADQTSADTQSNGRPCGAFTHFLIEAIQALPNNATPVDLCKEIVNRLARSGYDQVPQVDGSQQRLPFLRF